MKNNGFTIIEVLITIALIAVIGGTILYFLNPADQYAQARNTERQTHVNTIAQAVREWLTDNRGSIATACPSGPLPTSTTQIGNGSGNYNLEPCLIPTSTLLTHYLTVMPLDPSSGTSTATGYYLSFDPTSTQITISAPNAELGATISVTR